MAFISQEMRQRLVLVPIFYFRDHKAEPTLEPTQTSIEGSQ